MGEAKKRCFVVMGFGIKTDYVNGRKLDLNKSYRLLIKPVVEAKGIECIRADEILHSGSIDVRMYEELLEADLVIADLSTANPNALYELGVRHALRPYTTIVISEDKMIYPFDLNHVLISSYTHLGDAIDYEEVERFRATLGEKIDAVLKEKRPDSPVYTYLKSLIPPTLEKQIALEQELIQQAHSPEINEGKGKALSIIIEEAENAIEVKEFIKARDLFESAVLLSSLATNQKDTYLIHRLAFCLYKAAEPDLVTSLYKGLELLNSINLAHSNDPETVSTAGAIKKKLFESGEGTNHLEDAILFFQRSYYLLNNRYNGINLAITYVYRANSPLDTTDSERIADLVFARRTWQRVLYLCNRDEPIILKKEKNDAALTSGSKDALELQEYYHEQRFWIQVNRAESHFGLGDFEAYEASKTIAENIPHPAWMWESFSTQIENLKRELTKIGSLMEPKWNPPV